MSGRDAGERFTVRQPKRPKFAPIPQDLLLDREVSALAVRLWGVLDRIAGGRDLAIDSRAGLAEALAVSLSTLDRARACLEDAGWLTVTRVAGEASRYDLHDRKTPLTGTLVTSDDTPNGCSHPRRDPLVTHDETPSSLVTTEQREELRDLETPQTPAQRGPLPCGHTRPVRGCCSRDDQAAREAARASLAHFRAERAAMAGVLREMPEADPARNARGRAAALAVLADRKRDEP